MLFYYEKKLKELTEVHDEQIKGITGGSGI